MGRGKKRRGAIAGAYPLFEPSGFDEAVYFVNDQVVADHPGCYLELVPSSEVGVVYAEILAVPPERRGQGEGSDILAALCEAADRRGWEMRLAPLGHDRASFERLTRFYARFGFAYEADGAELMTRPAGRPAVPAQLERAAEPAYVEEGHFDQYAAAGSVVVGLAS